MPVPDLDCLRWCAAAVRRCVGSAVARLPDALRAFSLAIALVIPGQSLDAFEPPDLTDQQIERLIDDLGSGSLTTRQQATRQLLSAGPAVLEHLPPVDLLEDPSVREGVRQIRIHLEQQLAQQDSQPTRITLHGTFSLAEAAKQLSQATRNDIQLRLGSDAPASVDIGWENTTFWEAIADLTRASSLRIVPAEHRVILTSKEAQPDASGDPVAATSAGAFRIELVRASIRTGGIPLLNLRLRAIAEPRLHPLFATTADADLTVVTADQSLDPFNPLARREPEFLPDGSATWDVALLIPQGHPLLAGDTVTARIRGEFAVDLAAAPRQVGLGPLNEKPPILRRSGGTSVSLDRIEELGKTPDGSLMQANISVHYERGGPAFESFRLAMLQQQAWFESRTGDRQEPAHFELSREADGTVGVTYRFQSLPQDWRTGNILYEFPTAIARVPITFTVRATLPAKPVP